MTNFFEKLQKTPLKQSFERRKQLKMTQRQVAEKPGVAQPIYQRFEKGVYECSYTQLVQLCKLFDLSADYLLGLTDY